MDSLKNSIVNRSGSTECRHRKTSAKITVGRGTFQEPGVTLSFAIPAAGGGKTDIQVVIKPADFRELRELMAEVDERQRQELVNRIAKLEEMLELQGVL